MTWKYEVWHQKQNVVGVVKNINLLECAWTQMRVSLKQVDLDQYIKTL